MPDSCPACRRLSDVNGDGALNIMEFCIAMQLVFARRRGATLPDTLPKPLLDFCEPRRAVPPLAAAAVAAPSPSQLPLIDQSPCQSDSESEDESHTKVMLWVKICFLHFCDALVASSDKLSCILTWLVLESCASLGDIIECV